METIKVVRCLADHLSHLTPEESSSLEGSDSEVIDIKSRLSSHLVDQFWSCLLRNSIHCCLPPQCRNKDSRYSASRILADLDLGTRKRPARGKRHCDIDTDYHINATCSSVANKTRDAYQQGDVYVDVAISIHKQVMRQKGLHMECVALDTLLELYKHISHVPCIEHLQKYIQPSKSRWQFFRSRQEVLEMLCHASDEPSSCIASLDIARHVLLRKGIADSHKMGVKLMFSNWCSSPIGMQDAVKLERGSHTSSHHNESGAYSSELCTSNAFKRILRTLPALKRSDIATDSYGLGIEGLTISPSTSYQQDVISIHSAWLPVKFRDGNHMGKNTSMAFTPIEENCDTDRAKSGWITGSYLNRNPNLLDHDSKGTISVRTLNGSKDMVSPLSNVVRLEDLPGRVMKSVNVTNCFCYVPAESSPKLKRYNKWQVLPSFDSLYINDKADSKSVIDISVASIGEAMTGSTTYCLLSRDVKDKKLDCNSHKDWLQHVLLCLQGHESSLFQSIARCNYRKDPSIIPERERNWLDFRDSKHQGTIRKLLKTFFQDSMTSTSGANFEDSALTLTDDGNFVIINPTIAPLTSGEVRSILDLECASALKSCCGYKPLSLYFQEICHVGSTMRRLKYFILLVKQLQYNAKYNEMLGSTLCVYAKAIETFVYHFEKDVTNFAEVDFRGELKETLSVFSLVLRLINRWRKAISWFDDVTFSWRQYNEEGHGTFMLPRGCLFVDRILAKYAGAFNHTSTCDDHSRYAVYRCVISTIKPYLGALSQWVAGYPFPDGPSSEFQYGGRLAIPSQMKFLEKVVAESREHCSFIEKHYSHSAATIGRLYSRYLKDDTLNNGCITINQEECSETPTLLRQLLRELSLEVTMHHARVNAKMIDILRAQYCIHEIAKDIKSFLFLTRSDLMNEILMEWSTGRSSASFLKLFRSSVVTEVTINNNDALNNRFIELSFSTELFNRYLFDEEVAKLYNGLFCKLCRVHLALLKVAQVARWLTISYRGKCTIEQNECRSVLHLLQALTRGMYAALSNIQWYMHYMVLAPLYDRFMKFLDSSETLTAFLEYHLRFIRTACKMCFASEDSGRIATLMGNICSSSEALGNSIKTLGSGSGSINSTEQMGEMLSLEPVLSDLYAKFNRMIRELIYLITLSREPGPSQLLLIFSNTNFINH